MSKEDVVIVQVCVLLFLLLLFVRPSACSLRRKPNVTKKQRKSSQDGLRAKELAVGGLIKDPNVTGDQSTDSNVQVYQYPSILPEIDLMPDALGYTA